MRLTESEIDRLWAEHIGSRKIVSKQELQALQALDKSGVLPRGHVYLMYLSSKWWRSMRRKVLSRDGGRCVNCKSSAFLHVDHVMYRGMGNEHLEDLQTLCYRCHDEKNRRENKSDLLAHSSPGTNRVDSSGQLFSALRRKEDGSVRS